MTNVLALLLFALVAFSSGGRGDDGVPADQFGCTNPEVLYEILNLAEPTSARKRATLIARNCLSLVGAHYLLLGEEDGVAKIRVFANLDDWASSSIVFTLDEMLSPDDMLDPSAIAHE